MCSSDLNTNPVESNMQRNENSKSKDPNKEKTLTPVTCSYKTHFLLLNRIHRHIARTASSLPSSTALSCKFLSEVLQVIMPIFALLKMISKRPDSLRTGPFAFHTQQNLRIGSNKMHLDRNKIALRHTIFHRKSLVP